MVGKAIPGDGTRPCATIARYIGTSRRRGRSRGGDRHQRHPAGPRPDRTGAGRPEETVAVEDPGYQPRLLFRSQGLQVAGVPVDDEGLVDALPPRRPVRLRDAVAPPSAWRCRCPASVALLAWAERHDAAIEDDYDSEFRYGGRPIEPLHARHERPGHLRRLAVEVHAAHPPAGLRGDAAAAAQGRALRPSS